MGSMGMGIAKVISWKWELFDGNGRNENSTFSHLQSEEQNQWCYSTSASPGTSVDSDNLTVTAHQLRSAVSLTLMISATQKTINSKAGMNWQNMSTCMRMGVGGNGNKQWEWEGMGLKKPFPLISTSQCD